MTMSRLSPKPRISKHKSSAQDVATGNGDLHTTSIPIKTSSQTRADANRVGFANRKSGSSDKATLGYVPAPHVQSPAVAKVYNGHIYKKLAGATVTKAASTGSPSSLNMDKTNRPSRLTVPSTPTRQRHDSVQEVDADGEREPDNEDVEAVPDNREQQRASSLSSANFSAGALNTSNTMNSTTRAFEQLAVAEHSSEHDARSNVAAQPSSIVSFRAHIEAYLQALENWTLQNGDTRALQKLLQSVSHLSSGHQYELTQLAPRTPGPSSTTVGSGSGAGSSQRSQLGGATPNNQRVLGSKGKEASNNGRIAVKSPSKGTKRCMKLRCPLYFVEAYQCDTLHEYPRDLLYVIS